MKIKKGDTVSIISGKDRGKTAKVLHVYGEESRLLAEGINLKKKHTRPKEQGKKGQIVQVPAPFPSSIAMLFCSACNRAVRVGYKNESGKKVRICKRCQTAI
ncbi:MAG: 50S ribosomal protein L24 [Candidatus Sungbacteria bacterium]|nr:50S ribosomal protein L24 [Candidatus Sungbacteria bacterium]